MKIIVCVKQVPDTSGKVAVKADGTMDRAAMATISNPDDMNALEAALQLKDANPEIKVVVITMGPPPAESMLRECMAMGADEGVLVSGREFGGADTFATSECLAAAIRKIGVEKDDIIFCGRQAIDGDTAQVGVQIAIHLDLPVTTYVEKLVDVNETSITVQRQYEDRYQTVRMNYPCLITAIGDLNQPRYMSVGGCFDAYQKEIKIMTYADIADVVDESNVGLAGSPTYVATSTTKEAKGAGEMLKDLSADEAVAAIVEKLASKHII